MQGIESALEQYEGAVTIDVEFMDTKRITDEKHYENLYNLYKHKAGFKQYDVVITSDNNALAFVLRHRDELYPDVPVVFCGVRDLPESVIESANFLTGVMEEQILEPTVESALKLHPSAGHIVVIVADISPAGGRKLQLSRLIRRFGEAVKFTCLFELWPEQVVGKVTRLHNGSLVIFDFPFGDPVGSRFSFENAAKIIARRCNVPIYTTSREWIGRPPVIGGKINSGFHQGRAAARMAMRILDGESPENMPVLTKGVDRYIFDYKQLKRFGISPSRLPQGSIIINEPQSFYYLYKGPIWTAVLVVVGLAVMVAVLSANILRRRQAEKRLLDYQAKLKSLTSELSLTEERQRRRIAVELHDRIGQSLVISKVKLEQLRQDRQSFGDAPNILGDVCSSIGQAIRDTRLLTFDLSYPILYELGFEAAVAEWLAEYVDAEHGIDTEFDDDGRDKPLEDDIRVLLFRSVREVLINVVKHARAHKVKVFSRKVDSRIHVGVEDDGVGFNFNEVSSIAADTGGFGLFSIRERIEQVGGRFEVDSEPGRGTKVMIVAPLKQ